MLIDWFTVAAQALNFLILVALLKRFLYRPVLDAIDAREARIARQIADAKAQQAQAEAARESFEQQRQAFEYDRAALMQRATQEAQAERERLLAAAREAADALAARRRQALDSETARLQQNLDEQASHAIFAIARKTLSDLADTSLETRMAGLLIARLQALDGPARAAFASALAAPGAQVLLRSAFELPATQRDALQAAVWQTFGPGIDVAFETTPALVGGIELAAGGRTLAWGIAPYLASLEGAVSAALNPAAPEPAPAAEPG